MICAQVGTRPVAASAAAAADLKRRNPGTFDEKLYKPLVPRNASAPVPIMLGALEGPASLAPLENDAPYFPLAMGPTLCEIQNFTARARHTDCFPHRSYLGGRARRPARHLHV